MTTQNGTELNVVLLVQLPDHSAQKSAVAPIRCAADETQRPRSFEVFPDC
jgi:hypothetical protein